MRVPSNSCAEPKNLWINTIANSNCDVAVRRDLIPRLIVRKALLMFAMSLAGAVLGLAVTRSASSMVVGFKRYDPAVLFLAI